MKFTKKKIMVIALAVSVAAVISMGSLAWFTDEDSVTNDFLVGDSTTDPDKVFGVDVWETVDGKEVGRGDTTENGHKYEAILPGEILNKAPVLENTGVHPVYARAIVTVSGADILKAAMGDKWAEADLFLAGTDTSAWKLQDILYLNSNELVYVYYYKAVLPADDESTADVDEGITAPIFTDVVIPTELSKEQAALIDNFSVTVLGQVIQSEHIQAYNSRSAFAEYWDEPGTISGFDYNDIVEYKRARVMTLADLRFAIASGETNLVLENDIIITANDLDNTVHASVGMGVVINTGLDYTLDLNGCRLVLEDTGAGLTALFNVIDGTLNIVGNGSLVQNGDSDYLIWAKGCAVVNINQGVNAIAGGDSTMFYASSYLGANAAINVYGGNYNASCVPAYEITNVQNHGLGTITYYGGTFNWHPENDVGSDDAAHINVATGYKVVDQGNGTYKVVAE